MYWRFPGDPSDVGFPKARIFDLVEDTTTGVRWVKIGGTATSYRRAADVLNFVLNHTHPETDIVGLLADLNDKQNLSAKGQPAGYCDLNASGYVPFARIPTSPEVHTSIAGGSERWYVAGQEGALALVTGAPTANVIRAMPIRRRQGAVVDKISITVTAGVAGNARLGIYLAADNGSLWPGDLLVDAGEVATATNGVKTISLNDQIIPRGAQAWAVIVTDAASTIRCLPVAACWPIFGVDTTMGVAAGVGASATLAYGALPPTFPTAGGAAISAVPIPAIALHYSS